MRTRDRRRERNRLDSARSDGARRRSRRRGGDEPAHGGIHRARGEPDRREAGFRRRRAGNADALGRERSSPDHVEDAGPHAGAPLRQRVRHRGRDGAREGSRSRGGGGRLPGSRRPPRRKAPGKPRHRGDVLLLSDEEPGRARRRRDGGDAGRRGRGEAEAPSQRRAVEPLPRTTSSASTAVSTRSRPPCCG